MKCLFWNLLRRTGILLLMMALPLAVAETLVPRVQISTELGQIEVELMAEVAPRHVENFLQLARSGFYNGTLFHRVIPGFMIQGGDPLTKADDKSVYGTGGPGYSIAAEFSEQPHVRGVVSMARAAHPDSAGSQFFIAVEDAQFLDGQYTVFGRVVSGMEVADKIVAQPRDAMDNPLERIEMTILVLE